MNIDTKLYSAVGKALNISPEITIHSIIRYIERGFKVETNRYAKSRASYPQRAPDGRLNQWLLKNMPTEYENAIDYLKYVTRGRVSTFTDDGIKFIIRDLKLITVYEE